MKVIDDAHEAVLTKPGSSVTYPVSFSSAPASRPDGPSVASVTGSGSDPPGCLSSKSAMERSLPFGGEAHTSLAEPRGQGLITVTPAGKPGSPIAGRAAAASSSVIVRVTSRSGRSRPDATSPSIAG